MELCIGDSNSADKFGGWMHKGGKVQDGKYQRKAAVPTAYFPRTGSISGMPSLWARERMSFSMESRLFISTM